MSAGWVQDALAASCQASTKRPLGVGITPQTGPDTAITCIGQKFNNPIWDWQQTDDGGDIRRYYEARNA